MGVICFGSLKGGVGKTSLSVNIAHGFAEAGCEVLLIDLDPMAHASRFFGLSSDSYERDVNSPMARLFLGIEQDEELSRKSSEMRLLERAISAKIPLVQPVRRGMAVISGSQELRHFLWGRGARLFRTLFPQLLKELSSNYDYIVIDTPPDFNVLTRNAIAASDLVVVPVDSSAMSIRSLEEIVRSSAHIKKPAWAIARTMVTRQASRMQKMTAEHLQEKMMLLDVADELETERDEESSIDIGNPNQFFALLNERELDQRKDRADNSPPSSNDSPIYLLRSVIYRSEQQNRYSFLGKTAFDIRRESSLRTQYNLVAREIEHLISLNGEEDSHLSMNENFPMSFGIQ